MNDNYNSTILDLARFMVANAPPGAEREVERLKRDLSDGVVPSHLSLEFRNENTDSCHLYIRIEPTTNNYRGIEDSEGNLWATFKISCQVSWPSYGGDLLDVCQRRIDLMIQTMAFARQIEANFTQELCQLILTKAQRDEREALQHKNRAERLIQTAVKANCKGMRIGQKRQIEIECSTFEGRITLDVIVKNHKFHAIAGGDIVTFERVSV